MCRFKKYESSYLIPLKSINIYELNFPIIKSFLLLISIFFWFDTEIFVQYVFKILLIVYELFEWYYKMSTIDKLINSTNLSFM